MISTVVPFFQSPTYLQLLTFLPLDGTIGISYCRDCHIYICWPLLLLLCEFITFLNQFVPGGSQSVLDFHFLAEITAYNPLLCGIASQCALFLPTSCTLLLWTGCTVYISGRVWYDKPLLWLCYLVRRYSIILSLCYHLSPAFSSKWKDFSVSSPLLSGLHSIEGIIWHSVLFLCYAHSFLILSSCMYKGSEGLAFGWRVAYANQP